MRLKAVEIVDASRGILEGDDDGPIIRGDEANVASHCPICDTILMQGIATGSVRGFYLRCKCGHISVSG